LARDEHWVEHCSSHQQGFGLTAQGLGAIVIQQRNPRPAKSPQ
jgi:hypothetical protein